MKLLVALALAAVPSALAIAPYVPPTPQPPYIINGEECPEGSIVLESGAGACFSGDVPDAEGGVCANDNEPDVAYCSYVPDGFRCARCGPIEPPYLINGEECPESNIMIESGAGACFDDGKDAEGSVCANDGTIDEAYCSYVPEGYRCARCE